MPVIQNSEIIKFVDESATEMEALRLENEALEKKRTEFDNNPEWLAINEMQEKLNIRALELNKKANQLRKLLDNEYGWGNWHNLNIKDYTYQTREELEKDPEFVKKFYVVQNPAIKDRKEADDIQIAERKVMNDPELCATLDKLIEEQKQAGKVH